MCAFSAECPPGGNCCENEDENIPRDFKRCCPKEAGPVSSPDVEDQCCPTTHKAFHMNTHWCCKGVVNKKNTAARAAANPAGEKVGSCDSVEPVE